MFTARAEEFQDTPQISFADDSHAIFSATPRMKMEPLLLSPTSSSKCNRSVDVGHVFVKPHSAYNLFHKQYAYLKINLVAFFVKKTIIEQAKQI